MTGVWVTNDTISAVRMNEKTIFQGSGSTINGLTTYAGMMAFCTSSGNGFIADNLYQRDSTNSSWSVVGVDKLPYLTLSTSSGDYTDPASVTVSSGTTPTTITQGTGVDISNMYGGAVSRVGAKLATGSSALIGKNPIEFTAYLKKTGSPTGNVTCVIRNSSDTILETSATTVSSASLTGSETAYAFAFTGSVTLASGDWIGVEFTGGSAGNTVDCYYSSGASVYDGANTTMQYYNAGWFTDGDMKFILKTGWLSTSEANPNAYYDFSSDREIVSLRITLNTTSTNLTAIKIRASTDTSFNDAENVAYINVSDFTSVTARYIAINFLSSNRRYVQVYGVGTGILGVNTLSARYGVTDLIKILTHKHKTRNVSAADSFVDSN